MPLDQCERMLKTLIAYFGSDRNVCSRASVLRVPGFLHQKDPANAFMVRIHTVNHPEPYTFVQLQRAFPAAESRKQSTKRRYDKPEVVPEGQRDTEMTRFAGYRRQQGDDDEQLLAEMLKYNRERFDPPLTDAEVEKKHKHYCKAFEQGSNACIRKCTDMGNAERLIDQYGEDVCYIHAFKKWLIWDGQRWIMDDSGHIQRLAKATVRHIYTEAADIDDPIIRDAVAKHARNSEAAARLSAMSKLAESERPMAPEKLDADPWLLGVANGTINLRTGGLHAPRREDFITKQAGTAFDPAANCPLWLSFLDRIFEGDAEMLDYVQRIAGYALTGDTREQCLFVLHGSGANGKSVFLSVLHALLGDYAVTMFTQTIMTKAQTGANNDVAALRGARLAEGSEVEEGQRMAESSVKQMTGGDRIQARFLYGEFFEFIPQFKILLAANHKPRIRGDDYAIWRRIRLLPFAVTIPEGERDGDLTRRLLMELPGILNWAVAGCLKWQKDGLKTPRRVTDATNDYREEQDLIRQWMNDCCVVQQGAAAGAAALYQSYKEWAKDNDLKFPLSKKGLGMKLADLGFERVKSNGVIRYRGIGIAAYY